MPAPSAACYAPAVTGCAYVIGGAGFIGAKLVDALVAEGSRVVVVDPLAKPRSSVSTLAKAVAPEVLDDLFATDPPTEVFHLGGSGSVGIAEADPEGDLVRTVESTRVLLERCLSFPKCRLILVSSAAVYGDTEAASLPESTERRPISVYGRNKSAAEDLVSASRATGSGASIVRFFSVYGPGLRKQLLWDACTRLRRDDSQFGGTGDELRDWLHVDDAVTLLRTVARAPNVPAVVNGGTGTGTSVREVLSTLAEALGANAALRFSGVARAGDPLRMVADVHLAHELGWSPSRDLRDGLREYARWFETLS